MVLNGFFNTFPSACVSPSMCICYAQLTYKCSQNTTGNSENSTNAIPKRWKHYRELRKQQNERSWADVLISYYNISTYVMRSRILLYQTTSPILYPLILCGTGCYYIKLYLTIFSGRISSYRNSSEITLYHYVFYYIMIPFLIWTQPSSQSTNMCFTFRMCLERLFEGYSLSIWQYSKQVDIM